MRTLLFLSFLLACTVTLQAQDNPNRQQTGTGGQVVVIDDQGTPQSGNTPQNGQAAGETPRSTTGEQQQTTADSPAKTEGDASASEGKEGEDKNEAAPETPRVRRVYKKDTTRRVVLRRRTRSGGGTVATREQREGYRIQIFTGGNRRQDRQHAEALAERIRKYFPELSAYTHFVCPRWTCRVGDFEKPEQASRYVSLILRSKISVEARIIKTTVWLPKKK